MPRGRKAPAPNTAPVEQAAIAQPAAAPSHPTALNITIDIDAVSIDDLDLLSRIRRKAAHDEEVVAFLRRVVVGGVAAIPRRLLSEVLLTVFDAVYATGNPETDEGN